MKSAYKKIIDLIMTPSYLDNPIIPDKYKMLFNRIDNYEIVILGLMFIIKKQDMENNSVDWKYTWSRSKIEILDIFYKTLPFEDRKKLLFSIGIYYIISLDLDEIGSFKETILEINRLFNAGQMLKPVIKKIDED